MVGVAKRLRPRIVVPVFVGSIPITHPIKTGDIFGYLLFFYDLETMGIERLNAMRMSIAGEGLTEPNNYFRQR